MSKITLARKLLSNPKARQGAIKLAKNPYVRQSAVWLAKNPRVRRVVLKQVTRQLRRG